MKLLKLTTAFLFISAIVLKSQECKIYIPANVGTETELTSYDKKDKPTGIIKQTLKEITQSGDTTIYKIHQIVTDEKGKNPIESNFSYKCVGEIFYLDMNAFIDEKTKEAYKDMQMKITTDNLSIPSNITVGQQLNDGYIKMDVLAGAFPITLQMDINNRKVESFEDISTSAGNFSCIKISEDDHGTFGFVKTNFHTIYWYSEKIGTVRSETYRQGKLESYMVLTSFKK